MKPETMLILGVGIAGLLWYMDKQQTPSPVAAVFPTLAPAQPVQVQAPASPQPAAPASPQPVTVDIPPVFNPANVVRKDRYVGGPVTQPVDDVQQRNPGRVSTTPVALSSIPMYGGWK